MHNYTVKVICLVAFGLYETNQSISRSSKLDETDTEVSWAAHLGGAVTGLTLGLVLLRNKDRQCWESCLTIIFFVIFVIYVGTISYLQSNPGFLRPFQTQIKLLVYISRVISQFA